MTSIRKSFALSFAQRNCSLVISFVSSLIIARLLTPHEIGIFSIGSVIVSFSHIVRDMGVSNYVIQERDLTNDRTRSAQAIIWITSWGLALVLFLFSFWAGEFYKEPGVTLTMQVLAISFLFLPVGAVTVALLTREMAFGQLFVINLCSALIQALVGILMAWAGFGFISLAWSAVAGASASAVGSVMCRRAAQPWVPGLREWRRVFAAGTKLSGTSMFYELGLGGPELVTGRILGFEAVAYFSRGFGAAMMVLRSLVESFMPVAIPYFAKQSRMEQDLEQAYLRGIAYMSAIALPAFACLGVLAKPAILFLYGDQWLHTVIPLQIVSVGLACLAVTNVAGSVLIGSGELLKNFRMHAFFQPCKVLLVALGAMSFGLTGVATGVAIGDVSISVCCFIMTNRLLGVTTRTFSRWILPSTVAAIFAALVAWATLSALVSREQLVVFQITISGLGAGIGWIFGLILTRHPILHEMRRIFLKRH